MREAIYAASAASHLFWDDGVEYGSFGDACGCLALEVRAHLVGRAEAALSASYSLTGHERGAIPCRRFARIRADLKRAFRGVPAAQIISEYRPPDRLLEMQAAAKPA